jgi:hypothetical protein
LHLLIFKVFFGFYLLEVYAVPWEFATPFKACARGLPVKPGESPSSARRQRTNCVLSESSNRSRVVERETAVYLVFGQLSRHILMSLVLAEKRNDD